MAVRAFHEGGQVMVEVEDDGRGIDPEKVRQKAVASGCITAEEAGRLSRARDGGRSSSRPGFSTAEPVTAISGRGVGMDVVRTNVERIGGSVEMVSRTGRGSVLPDAGAAHAGDRARADRRVGRRAVRHPPGQPAAELVRVPPEREARMLADVQGTPVLRLRGGLLPLVDLAALLGTGRTRRAADGARSVVVLSAQGRLFGVCVDDVADTEEIVVKPLAGQLQQLGVYSGATVRGDGRVALVLDVRGLARRGGVLSEGEARARLAAESAASAEADRSMFLLLRGADDGRLAIPLRDVTRVEEVDASRIERTGSGEAMQYRGGILPIVRLAAALDERRRRPRLPVARDGTGRAQVVVHSLGGRDVGLLVDSVLDVVDEAATLDTSLTRRGVAGRAVIQGRITEVVDAGALLSAQASAAASPELEVHRG